MVMLVGCAGPGCLGQRVPRPPDVPHPRASALQENEILLILPESRMLHELVFYSNGRKRRLPI